ncbi:hypothetical protein C8R43DRAFT_879404, partial [Mycena crocata]
WTSHIYTFYQGDVRIEYRNDKLHHIFTCAAWNCNHTIHCNQTSKDSNSTKNLRAHAKKCWGEDNMLAAEKVKSLGEARKLLKDNSSVRNQRLTDIFKAHAVAGGESSSHVPLTNEQSRLRPFTIAKDQGYRRLMKSGRPSAYIPSPTTIVRDVKLLFHKTRERLKSAFRYTNYLLATEVWTSPNHRAYVAVSGHWEEDGKQINCLLDFVEVAKVRLLYWNLLNTHQYFSPTMARILRMFLKQLQRTSISMENSLVSPVTMPPPTMPWSMPSRPNFLPSMQPRIVHAASLTSSTWSPKAC